MVEGQPALNETVGLFIGRRVVVLRIFFEQSETDIVHLDSLGDIAIVQGQNLTASVSVKGKFAATSFFRSERISWRISWMLASFTCSSVTSMPFAARPAAR